MRPWLFATVHSVPRLLQKNGCAGHQLAPIPIENECDQDPGWGQETSWEALYFLTSCSCAAAVRKNVIDEVRNRERKIGLIVIYYGNRNLVLVYSVELIGLAWEVQVCIIFKATQKMKQRDLHDFCWEYLSFIASSHFISTLIWST